MAARKKSARKKTARKSSGKSGTGSARKTTGRKAASRAVARKSAPRKKAARGSRAAASSKGSADAAFPEIEALAELMEKHGLHEVSYTRDADGSTSLHVSKGNLSGGGFAPAGGYAAPLPAAAPTAPAAAPGSAPTGESAGAPAAPPAADENLHAFKSPMVGTFYRTPSPEAAPFVTTGDSVDPSSVVCIIEAMKVMNEIVPDVAGEIVSIEVENGEAVEFGQTLMLIRPR